MYSLRLNLEQLNNVIDGWVENRKHIEENSLDSYDAQFQDILEQFSRQGVEVIIEPENDRIDDEQKAHDLIDSMKDLITDLSMDRMEMALLLGRFTELEFVLFGK
jgi:hypothetical protein